MWKGLEMNILVTGNKGYIGSLLCQELIKQNYTVLGIDTDLYNSCNFFPVQYPVGQINKDVRDITEEDLAGIDAIIHLAALSNDPMGELRPLLTDAINCQASVKLAKLAKANKVKRFIFSSSCSIYGKSGNSPIDETGMLSPLTEYAKSKVNAEKEISILADGIFSPVFLRNATVYGLSPMLRVDLVVNNLTGWAYTTKRIKIMSDGSPWRPLIHIQDICKAFIATLKAPQQLIHNETFNIGKNSENYQIKEIADMIKKIMPECAIEYTKEHGSDSRTYKVDFSKARAVLGKYFRPDWNMERGIRELIAAFETNNFNFEDFQSHKFTRLKQIHRLLASGKVDENLFWKKGARL